MPDRYFVDTNVFVYARTTSDEGKRSIAISLLDELGKRGQLYLSIQVISEFWSVLRQKWHIDLDTISHEIDAMMLLNPSDLTADVIAQALRLAREHHFSSWDALIISSALKSECTVILSEDLADGARYQSLIVRNPFKEGFALAARKKS